MEPSQARVNIYDYGRKRSARREFSIFISRVLEFIITIALLGVIIFSVYKYTNKEEIARLDLMAEYTFQNLHSYMVNNPNLDFKVVFFPDTEGIASRDGIMINGAGSTLPEFEEGYIIMYKDGTYSFELQSNGYCLEKKADAEKYSVHIFKKCNVHELDDLKK